MAQSEALQIELGKYIRTLSVETRGWYPVTLIKVLDQARLSVHGEYADLRWRYIRHMVRVRFGDDSIEWDSSEDERDSSEGPVTFAGLREEYRLKMSALNKARLTNSNNQNIVSISSSESSIPISELTRVHQNDSMIDVSPTTLFTSAYTNTSNLATDSRPLQNELDNSVNKNLIHNNECRLHETRSFQPFYNADVAMGLNRYSQYLLPRPNQPNIINFAPILSTRERPQAAQQQDSVTQDIVVNTHSERIPPYLGNTNYDCILTPKLFTDPLVSDIPMSPLRVGKNLDSPEQKDIIDFNDDYNFLDESQALSIADNLDCNFYDEESNSEIDYLNLGSTEAIDEIIKSLYESIISSNETTESSLDAKIE